jgi:hypothetical protein
MKEIKQKDTNPMEEAYKLLDGSPAADAVSKAAKGESPESDNEQREEAMEEKSERLYDGTDVEACDLQDAYAMLFQGLAAIMKHK